MISNLTFKGHQAAEELFTTTEENTQLESQLL